jgi:hypothetical protein
VGRHDGHKQPEAYNKNPHHIVKGPVRLGAITNSLFGLSGRDPLPFPGYEIDSYSDQFRVRPPRDKPYHKDRTGGDHDNRRGTSPISSR